jgi:hypothetical protein
MSAFVTDLFQSIFTPGPTSSLIVATNASFAALQLVLFLLLLATYSIHFVVLSFLSAALWWAINWFVNELNIARAEEEKKKRLEETAAGDDTETEAGTVIDAGKGGAGSGSKEVEVVARTGQLKDRADSGSKSEISTEDEWERVSENEKDK